MDDSAARGKISWSDLLQGIRDAFATEKVDLDAVKTLLSSYESKREDWEAYAIFDPNNYTRNLVDDGNGRYNVTLLCFGAGHGTTIHDHADSHCFMRVMDGTVKEVQYAWPDSSQPEGNRPITQRCVKNVATDEVAYIDNTIGLHHVENASQTNTAISMQIYCPPITTSYTFEESTGQPHSYEVTFYSKFGSVCQT